MIKINSLLSKGQILILISSLLMIFSNSCKKHNDDPLTVTDMDGSVTISSDGIGYADGKITINVKGTSTCNNSWNHTYIWNNPGYVLMDCNTPDMNGNKIQFPSIGDYTITVTTESSICESSPCYNYCPAGTGRAVHSGSTNVSHVCTSYYTDGCAPLNQEVKVALQTCHCSCGSVTLLSPGNGTTSPVNTAISITTSTNFPAGVTIAKCEFYATTASTTKLIGTVTSSPYSLNWTPTVTGNYSIMAKFTDSNGGITYSSSASVTVQ